MSRGRAADPPWRFLLEGGAYYLGRHAFVSLVSLGTTVALAWLMTPADFGMFALTVPLVTAGILVMDLGLCAALVRAPDAAFTAGAPRVFWFQQAVGAAAAAALAAGAGGWARWFGLPAGAAGLLRWHALVLLVLPCRNMAVAHLERALRYKRISTLEAAEETASKLAVLLLAWRGAGAWALVAGPLVRGVLGAAGAAWLAGWRPGPPRRPWPVPRSLFRFGVTYQATHLVSVVREMALPLVVGSVCGPQAVGYVAWAMSIAQYPLMLVFSVGRLWYPLFARVRRQAGRTRELVQLLLRASLWGMGGACVPLFGLVVPLIGLVFSPRWLPAVPLFLILVPLNLVITTTFIAESWLNSAGLPAVRLRYGLWGAATQWVGTLATVHAFGMLGYAASYAVMSLVNAGVVREMWRRVGGLAVPWRPLGAAILCAAVLRLAAVAVRPAGWGGLVGMAALAVAAYLLLAGRPLAAPRRAGA